jgi:hypothetical protein
MCSAYLVCGRAACKAPIREATVWRSQHATSKCINGPSEKPLQTQGKEGSDDTIIDMVAYWQLTLHWPSVATKLLLLVQAISSCDVH